MEEDKYEKVLLRYYSPVMKETVVETLWAKEVDKDKGLYTLDSIPFYGPSIATDDLFFAEYDEDEQFLTYRKTVEYSGNSVVLVVMMQVENNREEIREQFKQMGCLSEGLGNTYFSMEILVSIDYQVIKNQLDKLEASGIIEYAEPCLSAKHHEDLKIKP